MLSAKRLRELFMLEKKKQDVSIRMVAEGLDDMTKEFTRLNAVTAYFAASIDPRTANIFKGTAV